MLRIKAEARLILTVPGLKQDDNAMDIMLAAEMNMNDVAAVFIMHKTKTEVGIRLHVDSKGTKVE